MSIVKASVDDVREYLQRATKSGGLVKGNSDTFKPAFQYGDIGQILKEKSLNNIQVISHDPLKEMTIDPDYASSTYSNKMDAANVQVKLMQEHSSNQLGEAPALNTPWGWNPHDDTPTNPHTPKLGRGHAKLLSTMKIMVVEVGQIIIKKNVANMFMMDGNAAGMNSFIKNKNAVSRAISASWNTVTSLVKLSLDSAKLVITGSSFKGFYYFKESHLTYAAFLNDMISEVGSYYGVIYPGGGDGKRYMGGLDNMDYLSLIPTARSKGGTVTGARAYMPWAINNSCSISESISNSTMESPIVSMMNSFAQETATNVVGADAIMAASQGGKAAANKFLKNIGKKTVGKVVNAGAGVVLSGDGRVVLPEIFSNSTFSRSYSMNFVFKSPYGHVLSTWENTTLPYLMWMVMAAPRQLSGSTYTEPFAVRLFARGMFTCSLGMITDMSKTAGDDKNDWTIFGFPKTIELSVTVKDLLPTMSISTSASGNYAGHEANQPMRDYMQILGGLDLESRLNVMGKIDRFMDKLKYDLNVNFSSTNLLAQVGRPFKNIPLMYLARERYTADAGITTKKTAKYYK